MTENIENLTAEAAGRLKKCLDDGWPEPAEAPRVEDIRTVLAALGAVQPVTPDRAAVQGIIENLVGHYDARVITDELFASGVLGQPQPQPDRERIAQAIHDGPNAQQQYVKAGIGEHSWEDCPYQEEYLLDADTVLPLLGQPRTDAPLDPKPLRYAKSNGNDERNRTGILGLLTSFPDLYRFDPRPGFEQDQARYPRTDTEDGR